jgi:hypothetical protein
MASQLYQIAHVVTRSRAALDETYGPRIEQAVLLGLRERGDAGPDSGYHERLSCQIARTCR